MCPLQTFKPVANHFLISRRTASHAPPTHLPPTQPGEQNGGPGAQLQERWRPRYDALGRYADHPIQVSIGIGDSNRGLIHFHVNPEGSTESVKAIR